MIVHNNPHTVVSWFQIIANRRWERLFQQHRRRMTHHDDTHGRRRPSLPSSHSLPVREKNKGRKSSSSWSFFFFVVDWAMTAAAAIMVAVVVMRWKSRCNRIGVQGIGDGGGGCGTPGPVVVVTVSGGPRLEDVLLLFHKHVDEPSAFLKRAARQPAILSSQTPNQTRQSG
jgi:hypothetical protein